jgi:hypothetical protein
MSIKKKEQTSVDLGIVLLCTDPLSQERVSLITFFKIIMECSGNLYCILKV